MDHSHEEVTKCMKESTEEVKSTGGNVNAWLDAMHKRIKENVPFTARELKEDVTEEMQSTVECFQNAMLTAWGNIDKESYTEKIYSEERKSIVDRVVEDVMKEKCGCLEHCPFCNAVCCCTGKDRNGKHYVHFHRPRAIGGVKWRDTNEAFLDICSAPVLTNDPFIALSNTGYIEFRSKEYETAGPPFNTWSISRDDSSRKFWKWILNRFSNELETEYGYTFEGKGKIPDEWKRITKEEAIDSIKYRM